MVNLATAGGIVCDAAGGGLRIDSVPCSGIPLSAAACQGLECRADGLYVSETTVWCQAAEVADQSINTANPQEIQGPILSLPGFDCGFVWFVAAFGGSCDYIMGATRQSFELNFRLEIPVGNPVVGSNTEHENGTAPWGNNVFQSMRGALPFATIVECVPVPAGGLVQVTSYKDYDGTIIPAHNPVGTLFIGRQRLTAIGVSNA